MPPRAKARAAQPQPPPPQPSDYETDAPQMAEDVPVPPTRSNEELNYTVLRRFYPDIVAINHVTNYTVLYTLNTETEEWDKLGVEGTMFLCQATPSPTGAERHCIVIYNRRGLNNFYLDLTSSDELETEEPFIILKVDGIIYGIWIFADPPPATTANCHAETAAKVIEMTERAKRSRQAHEEPESRAVQETPASVEMGRQLSLRELFGTSTANTTVQQPPQAYAPQQDVLGQLFMKAKQDYNGMG